jgi:hypothetical protein
MNAYQEAQPSVITDRAEALLRPIITYWIVELMDYGGSTPDATSEVVAEEEPDLCRALGDERVQELCEELHRAEDTAASERYGVRLHQFNKEYFEGRLGDCRVRVVFDLDFWMREPASTLQRSHIDLTERQIILGLTHDGHRVMEAQLLHHLAHASTSTTADDDPRWLQEMERLRDLGAPLIENLVDAL